MSTDLLSSRMVTIIKSHSKGLINEDSHHYNEYLLMRSIKDNPELLSSL